MVKRIKRVVTGTHAIERICNGNNDGPVPSSLQFYREWGSSRQLSVSFASHGHLADMNVPYAVADILAAKGSRSSRQSNPSMAVMPESSPATTSDSISFRENLTFCLRVVQAVNALKARIKTLQEEQFDSSNPAHERALEDLWTALLPGVKREEGRITREWGKIGFQQRDPASDFRGGGILGLMQLLHMATKRGDTARRMLVEPSQESARYPWACAGINVTYSAFRALQSDEGHGLDLALFRMAERAYQQSRSSRAGNLVGNGYATQDGVQTNPDGHQDALMLHAYNEIYADMLEVLHVRWLAAEPENVLAFGPLFDKAMGDCVSSLKKSGCISETAADRGRRGKSD